MLLNSVVIVFREVLEAALMISVLLAVSRFLQLKFVWAAYALLFGIIGAAAFGYYLGPVSELFDGFGQELVNAILQFALFAILALIVFWIARQHREPHGHDTTLPALMAVALVLAITREGSEVLIYVTGFVQMSNFLSSVGVGSLAGACIGFSIGVLFYYLLLALPPQRMLLISLIVLSLSAAGMVAQATRLLIQADWISVAGPVWNTSGILPEESLPGQLLYALIGYEASPSAIEVATYVASLAVMTTSICVGWAICSKRSTAAR